jgi:hypothetical protein
LNVEVSTRLVAILTSNAGIYRLPGPARIKRIRGIVTADDLVNRRFARYRPNELWVTDITEHPTQFRSWSFGETFHIRQRRHSQLGYLAPNRFEVASRLPQLLA